MSIQSEMGEFSWDQATGMQTLHNITDFRPQGALVPNRRKDRDQVAVVYAKGQTPPEITIREISGSIHTVLADGIAVAVVARAAGPALSPDDVLLVERSI